MATLHLSSWRPPKPPPVKGSPATKSVERPRSTKRPTKAALLNAGLSMRDVQAVMPKLFERFPEVFRPKRRPLAIHIHHAIRAQAPDILASEWLG